MPAAPGSRANRSPVARCEIARPESDRCHALVLGAALSPRHRERAFPIAAGDIFFQTTAVSVFSAIMLNALPMWRKNCGPHALAELRRKLQEEKAIFIIFPEGGRTRTG